MTLSPRCIFFCMTFFLFNKLTVCKNVFRNENETDFPSTTTVEVSLLTNDASWTIEISNSDNISNSTRDCVFESNITNNSVTARCNFSKTAAVNDDFTTRLPAVLSRNTRTANLQITPKPKPQKSTVVTKTPKRMSPTTKSAKLVPKKNNSRSQTTTAWPKSDKRLGNSDSAGGKNLYNVVKTTLNDTADRSIEADFKTKYPVDMWKDHGFYTDEYIELINSHWFTFKPPNPTSHYVLGVLYTFIMIFGCFGNSLVIFMYIKCKSLQTPANVLIMNLAVSDFIMMAKTPVFIYNSYYQGPTLGKLGCQIYGFFGGLTGTVSIMTLAAISLDRYYVIVHPLNAAVKTTKQRARVWIGLIWVYGFLFSVIPVLDMGYSRYVPEGYLTSCSFDYLTNDDREKGFILVFFAAAWCIPFTAISYCYVKILMAVWVTSEMAASRFGQEEEKRKTEIRLGYVVVGVIVLWFVSWTPYAVVALLGVFDQKEYITPLGSMIPALLCKAASCTDPWIYAITHPRFKNELTKLLSKKKTRKLERDYGMKKGWNQSRSNKTCGGPRTTNYSSTEDEDVEEVIVMVDPDDFGYSGGGSSKMHRQGSTSSHKTAETKALETKFPPTRQESLKYMPPSWYKMPRTTSKSSIKLDVRCVAGDNK